MSKTPLTDALNKHRENLGEEAFTKEINSFFGNKEASQEQMKVSELIDSFENQPNEDISTN
jgi:hypothetical protein